MIVEGHGDGPAVEILLRRYLESEAIYGVRVKPLRGHQGSLLAAHSVDRQHGVEYFTNLARIYNPVAILVLIDADDACRNAPSPLGPSVQRRAAAISHDIPVRVVLANREFEAWFLNAAHILFGCEERVRDAESRAGCKSAIAALLGKTYEPRIDQAKLASKLPFDVALGDTSRSYRRLLKVLGELADLLRRTPAP